MMKVAKSFQHFLWKEEESLKKKDFFHSTAKLCSWKRGNSLTLDWVQKLVKFKIFS